MASGIVRILTSPVALCRPRLYRLQSSIAAYLSVNLLETTGGINPGINKRKCHDYTDNDAKIVICNVSIKQLMKQLVMSVDFPMILADVYISSRLINSIYSSYFEQCFHSYDKVRVVPVEEVFKQPAMYFPIANSFLYGYTICDKEMDNCEQIVSETNQNTDLFEDIKDCGNNTELTMSPEETDQIDSVKTHTSSSPMNSLSNTTESEKSASDTDDGFWLVHRKWCNEHEPKRKKCIRRREQGVKKKWKPLEEKFVGFERSLLPRRQLGLDGEEIERLNDEIQFAAGDDKIEADAESVEEKPEACVSNTADVTEGDGTSNTESNSQQVLTNVAATELDARLVRDSSDDRRCDTDWDYEYDDGIHDDAMSDLDDMLDKNSIDKLNRYIKRRCHRSKKKQKIQKAHKQVKTKYCRTISNCSRGRTFYINHRVRKRMLMPLECLPLRWLVSVKQIDKRKGVKFCSEIKETIRQAKSEPTRRPPSARVGNKPMHTLTAFNADDELSPELVNILLLLQERDIMPEDYDMLLRLDDRVEAKTIDSQTLDSFETDTISEETAGDACPICMDRYIVGECRKRLPCGHKFHSNCIKMWLTNSSINCPLDGVPVMSDS